jgi:hypothetical protein
MLYVKGSGLVGRLRRRAERVALVAGMTVVTLNIWTGAPLLGLWVGSRVVGDSQITMLAVAVVAVTIFAACFALARVLALLTARYDVVAGRHPTTRRHLPWLRSMRGERPHELGFDTPTLTPLDYVLVGAVVLALIAFEIWFFFFSGSPLGGPNGRG